MATEEPLKSARIPLLLKFWIFNRDVLFVFKEWLIFIAHLNRNANHNCSN